MTQGSDEYQEWREILLAINNGGHVCDENDVELSIVVSLFVEA